MKIAFVILYLTYGASGTVEVPQHFASVEECQKTFEAITLKSSSRQPWQAPENTIPLGSCVPVMSQ